MAVALVSFAVGLPDWQVGRRRKRRRRRRRRRIRIPAKSIVDHDVSWSLIRIPAKSIVDHDVSWSLTSQLWSC